MQLRNLGRQALSIGMALVLAALPLTAEDFQAEVQVGGVIQLAGQVILVKLVVAGLVGHGVENPAFTEVIAPSVIAVTAEEGVVQVE